MIKREDIVAKGTDAQRWCQLSLLTLCYVFGELGHFLIGVTSRDVARDIHYGDLACFTTNNGTKDLCSQLNESK